MWVGTKFVVACVFELPIDEVKSCHELRPRSLSSLPRIHEENNTDKEVGDFKHSLQAHIFPDTNSEDVTPFYNHVLLRIWLRV